jgi:hypothetical protein
MWPAPLCCIFPHLITGTIFEKKKLLNTKCLSRFSLQLLCETFLFLRRNERPMIGHVYRSSCIMYSTPYHVRFEWNLNSLHKFLKNPQTSNFMKILPVGAELFSADWWTDRRTHMTKLIVVFRYFANALKNWQSNSVFSKYFCSKLSAWLHWCSILAFISMLLLSEGQMGEASGPFYKECSFEDRGVLDNGVGLPCQRDYRPLYTVWIITARLVSHHSPPSEELCTDRETNIQTNKQTKLSQE